MKPTTIHAPAFDETMIKLGHVDVDVYAGRHAAPSHYNYDAYPQFQDQLSYGSAVHSAGYYVDLPESRVQTTEYQNSLDFVRDHPSSIGAQRYERAPSSAGAESDEEQGEDDVDLSKLTKEELRKHKNRQSAARSRKRNRNRMEQLEHLVKELVAKNRRLEQEVRTLSMQRGGPSLPPQPHVMSAYYRH